MVPGRRDSGDEQKMSKNRRQQGAYPHNIHRRMKRDAKHNAKAKMERALMEEEFDKLIDFPWSPWERWYKPPDDEITNKITITIQLPKPMKYGVAKQLIRNKLMEMFEDEREDS